MNAKLKTLTLGLLLAALIPFSPAALAADPEKSGAAATPTPALHEIGASQAPGPAVAGAPAPAPAPTPASAQAPAVAPAPAAAPAPETPLHEIGAASAAAAAPAAEPGERHRHRHGGDDGDDRVSVGSATYVGPDEKVEGNAVAVMGSLTVDGAVHGNAVAVMGTNTINGKVDGNAVAVLGDLTLGPKARVDGDAVCVGGQIIKDPSAVVGGNSVAPLGALGIFHHRTASSWWEHGLSKGRPLRNRPQPPPSVDRQPPHGRVLPAPRPPIPGRDQEVRRHARAPPGHHVPHGDPGDPRDCRCSSYFSWSPSSGSPSPWSSFRCPWWPASSSARRPCTRSSAGRSWAGTSTPPSPLLVGVAVIVALCFIPVLGLMVWALVTFLGFACALTALFTSTKPAAPAGTPPAAPPPAGASSRPRRPRPGLPPPAPR